MPTATTIQIMSAATLTASGRSGPYLSTNISMAAVMAVAATAPTGTTPKLTMYLEFTLDSGTPTNFIQIPYDLKAITASAATDQTATANKRNILDQITAVQVACAIYKHFPFASFYLGYQIEGTASPTFTNVSVLFVGK